MIRYITMQIFPSFSHSKRGVEGWDVVYKGVDTTWRVNLTAEETYRFRVAAIRAGEQGPYSTASDDHFVVSPPTDAGGKFCSVWLSITIIDS